VCVSPTYHYLYLAKHQNEREEERDTAHTPRKMTGSGIGIDRMPLTAIHPTPGTFARLPQAILD